jgi:type VI protein secretion system component VasF
MTRTERDRETALAVSEASQAAIKRENAKHTPGPWEVHPTTLHPAVRSVGTANAAPRRICTVGSMNGNPVDERNARLIAAAPELLEAAIELKDVCNRPAAARTRAEAWRKLDAAIAKAIGDTE